MRERADLVLEHEQLGVSRAENDRDLAARLGQRPRDRVGDRSSDASADDRDSALPLGVRRHAEWPDHVGQEVAHLEVSELVGGLADAHEDEPDPAFAGGPVAEGERDALAALARPHHEELPGTGLGRDARGLDAHLEDGLRELALVDDAKQEGLRLTRNPAIPTPGVRQVYQRPVATLRRTPPLTLPLSRDAGMIRGDRRLPEGPHHYNAAAPGGITDDAPLSRILCRDPDPYLGSGHRHARARPLLGGRAGPRERGQRCSPQGRRSRGAGREAQDRDRQARRQGLLARRRGRRARPRDHQG